MAQRGAQPGNNNAAKSKVWEQALARAARPKDLEEIATVVVNAAKAGQQWAVQEIGNRLDGKPIQPMEHKVQTESPSLTDAYLAHVAAGGKPDEWKGTVQ